LCSDGDLRKIFEKFGDIRDVYIPKDFYSKCVPRRVEQRMPLATSPLTWVELAELPLPSRRRPRGFAFIEFVDERDAADAKADLDRMVLDGR
jgi:FUS-interacting serine-arginine-rich protein 1